MIGLDDDSSVDTLRLEVTESFRCRFKLNRLIHIVGWAANFLSLDQEEADLLEVPFSEEEIRRELMCTNGNKAPKTDGFTFKFAQKFWPKFKSQIVSLFEHFFESV